jgi:hypothetical protein
MTDRFDWSAKDRRREIRQKVDLDARVLPGGASCRIIDLSPTGARIRMHTALLPQTCVIVEWRSGRAHQARVMWRANGEAGLEFSRSCDLRGIVPAPFAAARTLWAGGRG